MSRRHPDERFEFLSDAWIEEAARFLRGAVPDVAFTFCEAFADPPPGVHGAWHVRIADGKVEAAAGEEHDTDLRLDGDYQAMSAIVQTVYAAGRAAIGRAHREMTHRHGPGAMRLTGEVPLPMQAVLAGLHDHMAVRTVENPHLEHRVRRLGLAGHAAELAGDGRTVVARAISEAFADELAEQVESELAAEQAPSVGGLLGRHRLFEEIVQHPVARTAAEGVLGAGLVLGSVRGGRGGGAAPTPDDGSVVASWVLADDGGVPKGSLVLTRGGTPRSEPAKGLTVDVAYTLANIAPTDGFGSVGDTQLRRNSPVFAALLDRDDTAATK